MMDKGENRVNGVQELSILDILKILLRRLWLIVAVTLVCGVAAFSITKFAISPEYTATAYLTVSNGGMGGEKVASGDIDASQKMIATCISVLQMDGSMDAVAQVGGLDIKNEYLKKMIKYTNDSKSLVIQVDVVSDDPDEAAAIANAVLEASPSLLEQKTDSIAKMADYPHGAAKTGPNTARNTLIGLLLGAVLSILAVLLREMLDQTIKSEEDVKNHYDLPVLGIVPDFVENGKGGYQYYGKNQ